MITNPLWYCIHSRFFNWRTWTSNWMFGILIPFSYGYMRIPNQYTNIKNHEYHVDISSHAWQRRICGARRALITILSSPLPGSSNKRLSPWKTCCKAFNINFSLTPNHSCWQLRSFRWCVEMSSVIVGSVRTVTGIDQWEGWADHWPGESANGNRPGHWPLPLSPPPRVEPSSVTIFPKF